MHFTFMTSTAKSITFLAGSSDNNYVIKCPSGPESGKNCPFFKTWQKNSYLYKRLFNSQQYGHHCENLHSTILFQW